MSGLPDPEVRPLLTVDELVATGVIPGGRSAIYEAVRRGELPSLRIGRRLLVPVAELRRMFGLDDGTARGTTPVAAGVALETIASRTSTEGPEHHAEGC